jgi:hypothetical protein
MQYSYQPLYKPQTMSSEEHRWMLVSDFVRFFNDYRDRQFVPSEKICVDESMIRWYGIGGDWINAGLPMYVAMDRKPENGGEIQNACCAVSGVMLRLRIVKSKKAELAANVLQHDINHGTAIIKELTMPWAGSWRVVAADSYFASVETAVELYKVGLRFVGVVKTATKRFPMAALASVEFSGRGNGRASSTRVRKDRLTYLLSCGLTPTDGTLCRRFHPAVRRRRLKEIGTDRLIRQWMPIRKECF